MTGLRDKILLLMVVYHHLNRKKGNKMKKTALKNNRYIKSDKILQEIRPRQISQTLQS